MSNGYIGLTPDSSGKKLRTRKVTEDGNETHDEVVRLSNTTDITINPATEDGNLATIAGKDFATQTTLALIKAKTDNLDTAISLLKTNQDTQIINQTTIQSLIETLQELSQRLAFLGSCSQSGRNALRIVPLSTTGVDSTVSTVTTVGTVSASTVTNFGTGIPAKEHADDMNNLVATVANIQNVVV